WTFEARWGINHIDHRVTGVSVADAIRDADNLWLFEQLRETERLDAWKATHLLVAGHPEPNSAIDVLPRACEAGIPSLQTPQPYPTAPPNPRRPRALTTSSSEDVGDRIGAPRERPVRHCEM